MENNLDKLKKIIFKKLKEISATGTALICVRCS